MNIVNINDLYTNDAIYFPIVVNQRHGIARYPISYDDDNMIIKDYKLLEFYLINKVNKELDVFGEIFRKLDTDANRATLIHPNIITRLSVIPIEFDKLKKKKVITFNWLSFRANGGELIAYVSLPWRTIVNDNIIERIIPNNIPLRETFADRFKFIINQLVNCYL